MFRILIDTCVWLDLAKDYQQQALLGVLEEFVRQKQIELILPRTIVNEFSSNKTRIVEESGRSLSSVLKRVKEAVDKFGEPKRKRVVLEQLNDMDHKLPLLGGTASETVRRIESLFAGATIIELNDSVRVRAAQRAIDRRAPFHRQRNGIDDAILMETYADLVSSPRKGGERFAFVTHNTKDFSCPNASDKLPHPDIAQYFSRVKSLYFIKLGEALRRVDPGQHADLMIEQEWSEEPRRLGVNVSNLL